MTRRALAAGAMLATIATLAGCGDPDLWARWSAERMLWHARAREARVAAGADARSTAVASAAAALDAIVAAYPPERWVAAMRPRARDVAAIAGTAALLRARLDERTGRTAEAERAYARVAVTCAAIDSVAVAAQAARAGLLERLDRDDDAAAAWAALAVHAAELDSAGVAPWTACGTAPAEAVRLLQRVGRPARADSLAQACAARMGAEAARVPHAPIADDMWTAVAELLRRTGRHDAARAALRAALTSPAADADARAARVLEIATIAGEAGEPDTAVTYAAWAAREFSGEVAERATLALAHAWEAAGVADSALPVYKRLIEDLPPMGGLAARARLDRARLLDRMDQWPAARAELRALAMMQPADPCGQAALVEIVRHHVREGEAVFAEVESKHALETTDLLLNAQRDPRMRVEALDTRAEVLALTGRSVAAESVYAATWRAYRSLPEASVSGWRAARLADSTNAAPDRAAALYLELAAGAADLDVRWRARRQTGDPAAHAPAIVVRDRNDSEAHAVRGRRPAR